LEKRLNGPCQRPQLRKRTRAPRFRGFIIGTHVTYCAFPDTYDKFFVAICP
jgi:hypothetical protein